MVTPNYVWSITKKRYPFLQKELCKCVIEIYMQSYNLYVV